MSDPTTRDAMMPAKKRRRTGLIVLWVVFALLLIGSGGVAAVFLIEQNNAVRTRSQQVAELEQANADLSAKKRDLTYASTARDQARVRYEREALKAERDKECVEHIQGVLREMRTKNHISVDHTICLE
jgi:uncharacterized protein (DUF3084 family)